MSIYHHDYHIELENDAILWRYMDIQKFESLLSSSSLFFCRAIKFPDPYECSIPKGEAEYRIKEQENIARFYKKPFDTAIGRKNVDDLTNAHLQLKSNTVVNCWHINKNESVAMWERYLHTADGVAIRTPKKRIVNTIAQTGERIGMSKVRYINYETDIWYDKENYPHRSYNMTYPLIHKRIEFIDESEFRLYHIPDEAMNDDSFWESRSNNIGLFIKVDLTEMIDSIVIKPFIKPDTESFIRELAKKFIPSANVINSTMSKSPYF
ncbi:MAG: hypothetical protein KBB64_02895 [Bacteroidia bacterium]|nr:hypothetical protein [Bacteroidia bacterium]